MTDDLLTERANWQPPAQARPSLNWMAVTYNASIAAGVLLISIGAGSRWGWPIGAISAGVLIIGLTLFAAFSARRSRG
jgi:hypothetical protein